MSHTDCHPAVHGNAKLFGQRLRKGVLSHRSADRRRARAQRHCCTPRAGPVRPRPPPGRAAHGGNGKGVRRQVGGDTARVRPVIYSAERVVWDKDEAVSRAPRLRHRCRLGPER